jgi:hypothetical protein
MNITIGFHITCDFAHNAGIVANTGEILLGSPKALIQLTTVYGVLFIQ